MSLRLEFDSATAAAEGFRGVGLGVQAVQLESGSLDGVLEVGQQGSVLFLRSYLRARTLFTGDKMPGYRPFCWMSGGGSSYFQAGTSSGGELCGFMDGRTEAHCHFNGVLNIIYLREDYFKGYFLANRAFKALDRVESCDKLPISPQLLTSAQALMEKGLQGKLADEHQVYSLITTALEEPQDVVRGLADCKNVESLHRLVELAHETASGEPLSLSEVCKMLLVSRSTLSAACKESYGLSVGSLLRMVRLEQCRIALREGGSVAEVMKRYRFSNRGSFARYYKAAFGELPSVARTTQLTLYGPDFPGVVAA